MMDRLYEVTCLKMRFHKYLGFLSYSKIHIGNQSLFSFLQFLTKKRILKQSSHYKSASFDRKSGILFDRTCLLKHLFQTIFLGNTYTYLFPLKSHSDILLEQLFPNQSFSIMSLNNSGHRVNTSRPTITSSTTPLLRASTKRHRYDFP